MDFFSDHKAPKTPTEKHDVSSTKHDVQSTKHDVPSTTELMSSTKIVADAARASLNNESDKLDKDKLADAAGDLLEAASHYGKLEENQNLGKYVQQAEDFLHNYKTTSTITTTTTTHTNPMDSSHSSGGGGGGDGHSGSGGYGDYIKMSEGLFDKHNPTTTTTSHSTTTTHSNPMDSSGGGYGHPTSTIDHSTNTHSSGGGGGYGHPTSATDHSTNTHSSGGDGGHSGSGGYGEYFKMAEGFLKKH